jgi:hypothetical protein
VVISGNSDQVRSTRSGNGWWKPDPISSGDIEPLPCSSGLFLSTGAGEGKEFGQVSGLFRVAVSPVVGLLFFGMQSERLSICPSQEFRWWSGCSFSPRYLESGLAERLIAEGLNSHLIQSSRGAGWRQPDGHKLTRKIVSSQVHALTRKQR